MNSINPNVASSSRRARSAAGTRAAIIPISLSTPLTTTVSSSNRKVKTSARPGRRVPLVREAGRVPLEYGERHRAGTEHPCVKRGQAESRALLRRETIAQLVELARAKLVRERLSGGVGGVPQRLRIDLQIGLEGVLAHVGHPLFARPSERVHPGVDDQPRRKEQIHREPSGA